MDTRKILSRFKTSALVLSGKRPRIKRSHKTSVFLSPIKYAFLREESGEPAVYKEREELLLSCFPVSKSILSSDRKKEQWREKNWLQKAAELEAVSATELVHT